MGSLLALLGIVLITFQFRYKKGDKNEVKNYRQIFIINEFSKIMKKLTAKLL